MTPQRSMWLSGYLLPALTDNWTHGAASRHTIAPISHTWPSPHSPQQVSYYSFLVPLIRARAVANRVKSSQTRAIENETQPSQPWLLWGRGARASNKSVAGELTRSSRRRCRRSATASLALRSSRSAPPRRYSTSQFTALRRLVLHGW